ncbi:MAG TPA: maleylacetoacetate isomerase [Burkholderiales bacterium]|nr:maleylacetoacetate isomerase [Burkholderiales bacterium]
MKLYTYFRSSAAFRVRIALNLKGIAYQAEYVHLPKGAHRAEGYANVNPQGLVPTLVTDEGLRLAQSLAIMEYLEETRPEPALLPRDPKGRARVRSISDLIACEIHPLNNLRTLQYLKRALGQGEDGINTWYRHWIADGLAKLEGMLRQTQGTGTYCHGNAPTMADCCLVPQIFNAKRYECDLAPYPEVMRVFDACMKLDAFDRAQPSKQPDAE